MESSGIACTGPVGPEGKRGSCSGFFFDFRWLCEVAAVAEGTIPIHRVPTHRTRTPETRLNFHPMVILFLPISPKYRFSGDTAGPPLAQFYHLPGLNGWRT